MQDNVSKKGAIIRDFKGNLLNLRLALLLPEVSQFNKY